MLIGLGQLNPTVGDLEANAKLILDFSRRAAKSGCDLFVTPELVITGYPPNDLLLKPHFVALQKKMILDDLARELSIPSLIGFVDVGKDGELYNAAAYLHGGRVQSIVHKTLLPTYDVFDERRYFRPAEQNKPVEINGTSCGITICEDIWDQHYSRSVVETLAASGASLLINLSSSPFHPGKRQERLAQFSRHAAKHQLPLVYCNLVGAQDELIFDGESMLVNANGQVVAMGPRFEEGLVVVETGHSAPLETIGQGESDDWLVFQALCLGVRDYFKKCGFERAVIGLSGGVDSALVACIAANALGPEQVCCVAMPSRYTADMSNDDAATLAKNLGVGFHVMPIENSVELAQERYIGEFGGYRQSVTRENLQARERGKILMEISNDTNALVLSTGNKTEYALGYTTLYGDMCGGLAVIGDVSKPQVYSMCNEYNARAGKGIIPSRILTRPPSAELREHQVDPFDYDRISPLVDLIVEKHLSLEELIGQGYNEAEAIEVFRLVRLSEYKRKQAPPILRVTKKAFGIGRKMPIINKFTQ